MDDLIVTGLERRHIEKFKTEMKKLFEMTDLELLCSYLGIEISQGNGVIHLRQTTYASIILRRMTCWIAT